ncbi:MAG: glycosyltransferase family 4 protein [Myxococcales bacterium]|nr:glycosyltransferase family 4 protein [Myxococcales bacterium]
MQFHILSFEGPDAYARAGGIATRVQGLSQSLAAQGFEPHLWFVGDPELPGHEEVGGVHHHRWCRDLAREYRTGVYDGELAKCDDYARSLPPWLLANVLGPYLRAGRRAVVLAEEWHTVHAVLHLDWLLRQEGLRDRVAILWNANNTFGFEHIPWRELAAAAEITTVSRYMRHWMRGIDVSAVVIPNGLGAEAFEDADPAAVTALQEHLRDRVVLSKVARWDRDKAWTSTLDIVELLRQRGQRPLLVARGGLEAYGAEVLEQARARRLRVTDRWLAGAGPAALVAAMVGVDDFDIVNLRSAVDAAARSVLFCGSDVVMANSAHEPFGLVGLEAMAVGGLACTGATGEDYAMAGRNAIVVQTSSPVEFVRQFERVTKSPGACQRVRAEGRATARLFDWGSIVERNLLPQVDVSLSRL